MIETALKKSNEEQRKRVFEGLKDKILDLSAEPYGRYVVIALLKYCNFDTVRDSIIRAFYGHVREMSQRIVFWFCFVVDFSILRLFCRRFLIRMLILGIVLRCIRSFMVSVIVFLRYFGLVLVDYSWIRRRRLKRF